MVTGVVSYVRQIYTTVDFGSNRNRCGERGERKPQVLLKERSTYVRGLGACIRKGDGRYKVQRGDRCEVYRLGRRRKSIN